MVTVLTVGESNVVVVADAKVSVVVTRGAGSVEVREGCG